MKCRSCPGIRNIIDEFWDAGGGGLELNIDASWETLNSCCMYIHSGVFLPPPNFYQKLELIKVAAELDMTRLRKLAIDSVMLELSQENFDVTFDFCQTFNIPELESACNAFKMSKSSMLATSIFDSSTSSTQRPENILENAYHSINDVSLLLQERVSHQSVPPTSRQYLEKGPQTIYSLDDYKDDRQKAIPSTIPIDTKSKPKSGGIYGLLLKETSGLEPGNRSQSIPGRDMSKTPLQKNKAIFGRGENVKASDKRPPAAHLSGRKPLSSSAAIVEFDKNMSLEPPKQTTEREQRCGVSNVEFFNALSLVT